MNQITDGVDLNISALAKDINVSHTNLWFYFNGQRKWNLECWLDTLAALGRLSIDDESMTIHIPINKETIEHYKRLTHARAKYIREPSPQREESNG